MLLLAQTPVPISWFCFTVVRDAQLLLKIVTFDICMHFVISVCGAYTSEHNTNISTSAAVNAI